jgi:hypothetical protein
MSVLSLTLAQQRRLLTLARTGVWARAMAARELDLFDALVAAGYATRETATGAYSFWYRYHITSAGKCAAEFYRSAATKGPHR